MKKFTNSDWPMRNNVLRFLAACLVAVLLGNAASVVRADDIDFEKQIRPLFLDHCAKCHGPKKQKGGLRLDARHAAFKGGDGGPVIEPGKSRQSELLRRITSDDEDERMPPKGSPISKANVDILKRWIDSGAAWPESDYDRKATKDPRLQHWAFQPIKAVEPPAVKQSTGADKTSLSPIDRFITAKLKDHNLTPSERADRRTLLRRLSFDLTGLPPTSAQVKAFEADDAPDAWSNWVEQTLKSPRYGERWAQHWLDIVRYADTHGFEVNTPRANAWPYRDYVIRAFNEDKPYDQFIREQLAGDAFQVDDATGFLVAAAVLLPGQIGKDDASKRLARQDALDEIINGTGATLLGLTIGCARCHDHKFDPITQRDYYAMQAFFSGVDYGERRMQNRTGGDSLVRVNELKSKIGQLERKLRQFEPLAFEGRTILIDEEDLSRVSILKKPNGPGANPPGKQRGHQGDPGDVDRVGNISGGRYTWWNNQPGEDVLTYNPGVEGKFRLWISWGAHGSGVHTRDARYVIDQDGDLSTRDDQNEIDRVDQYYLAGVSDGVTAKQPVWSGLLDVGVFTWSKSSKLVLRGGNTGTGITADVILLQELPADLPRKLPKPVLPRLREPLNAMKNIERFSPIRAKFVRFTTNATINNNEHQPCIDELEVFSAEDRPRNVALATAGGVPTSSGNYANDGSHQLKHINDGKYGNERSWISNQHGGGWVQIEFSQPETIDQINWGRDRNKKYNDRLPVRYQIEVSIDGKVWTTVASHSDRLKMGTPYDSSTTLLSIRPSADDSNVNLQLLVKQLGELRAELARVDTTRMIYGGMFRKPDTTYVLRRGDPEQRTTEINPSVPTLFKQAEIQSETSEQGRRLALAKWIASPNNPLTARVMVNRIWQQHFGRGLVNTPSDFGLNGMKPTHPELLDWLASEFIRSNWSIKHMHRLILNSKAYQRSSRTDTRFMAIDRNNRWLWRFQSRRLEGEAIRDSMLAVSGELNLKMGGPGFNFFKSRGGLNGFPPVTTFGPEEFRRMIYAHKIRMESVPVFGSFDCPDAGQAAPSRSRSTTAVQALNLFNSQFVIDRAKQFAKRVAKASSADVANQVAKTFELALGRTPSAIESKASIEHVRAHGLDSLARVLFNSNEFLFIP